MVTGIAQKAAQLYFHCGPLGKMIYQKWKKYKEEAQEALKGILIFKQRKMYTYPGYAITLSVFSLNITINIHISVT